MHDLSLSARVRQLVEPTLAPLSLEVVDVEQMSNIIRITVDRPGGIDLDAVSDATKRVSDELDRHDVLPGRCVLEVSSPGIERPLRTPDHFRRAVGSTITVKTRPGTEGARRLQGVLVSADDDSIVVGERTLTYADIDRARTVFEWDKRAKNAKDGTAPGGAGAPPRRGGRAGGVPARGRDTDIS